MKLLAHSLVPPTPMPYMHLGYLSATVTEPSSSSGMGGYIFFGLALAGVLAFYLYLKRRFLLGHLAAAICIGSLILVLVAFPRGTKVMRYAYPDGVTKEHIGALLYSAYPYRQQGDPVAQLRSQFQKDPKYLSDGWFHPFHILATSQGQSYILVVISSGKDERFYTEDDYIGINADSLNNLPNLIGQLKQKYPQADLAIPPIKTVLVNMNEKKRRKAITIAISGTQAPFQYNIGCTSYEPSSPGHYSGFTLTSDHKYRQSTPAAPANTGKAPL